MPRFVEAMLCADRAAHDRGHKPLLVRVAPDRVYLLARPRWPLHFIPTCSSWLNQVERFFGPITDKAVRRASLKSVRQLVKRIDHFVQSYNTRCQPFRWTATAESIPTKLERPCSRISGTGH